MQKYKEFFGSELPTSLSKDKILWLKENHIYYSETNFQPEISIVVIHSEENNQIIKLAVTFSYFMVEIVVLNSVEESITKTFRIIGQGAFSKVYEYKYSK